MTSASVKTHQRVAKRTLLASTSKGSGCGSVGRAVLATPEIRGSNPVIGNFIHYHVMNKLYRKENKEKRDRQWSNFLKKESRTLWATSVKIISKNLTLCTIENLLPSPLRFNIVNKTNMCVCCFRAYLYLLRGRNSFERQTCNLFIWTTKRAWGSLNATVGWRLKKDLLLFGSTYLPTYLLSYTVHLWYNCILRQHVHVHWFLLLTAQRL